ncbi:Uncharacterised protein [Legionella waltersii]|nr:Uncharacterised protein [Legionella waltersii]
MRFKSDIGNRLPRGLQNVRELEVIRVDAK